LRFAEWAKGNLVARKLGKNGDYKALRLHTNLLNAEIAKYELSNTND
jgi:hypothetical protein